MTPDPIPELHCRYCHLYGDESEIDPELSECRNAEACGLRCLEEVE